MLDVHNLESSVAITSDAMVLLYAVLWSLVHISRVNAQCPADLFYDYAEGFLEVDPKYYGSHIQRNFIFKQEPLESSYESGAEVEIDCEGDKNMAYPGKENKWMLKCHSDGTIKPVGGEEMKFNHCMDKDYCSAAFFERDWQIPGFKLHRDVKRFYESKGPIIAKARTQITEGQMKGWLQDSTKGFGEKRKMPKNIQPKASSEKNTYRGMSVSV